MFRSKKIAALVSLMPVVVLGINCIVSILFYLGFIDNSLFFDIVSFFFGQSLFSVGMMAFIVWRYNFCFYSKLAVFGLVLFILVNLIDSLAEVLDFYIPYALSFQCVATGLIFTCCTYFILPMEKINAWFEIITTLVSKFYNYIAASIYSLFIVLEINPNMVKFLSIMMIVDTFLGAAKYMRLGHKFSFKKLMWGLIVKLVWIGLPMLVALLGKASNYGDMSVLVETIIRVLAANEFLSLVTNAYCIKNKVEIKNVDFISSLLKALRKATESFLKNTILRIEKFGDCHIPNDEENKEDEQSSDSSRPQE